jgi:hypothetical protein
VDTIPRTRNHDTPTENRLNVALILKDLAYIKGKIDQVCAVNDAQDNRLDRIERVTWAVSSVAGLLAAIFVPIAVAAIKKWFGL